jgi:hypothetical protein
MELDDPVVVMLGAVAMLMRAGLTGWRRCPISGPHPS